jgi:hypothetical protein
MAILRAGPFASSSDSFLDEPTAATRSTLPVNCAKDTSSSSWPWKCYVLVDGSNDDLESYLSGFQSVSRTKSGSILLGNDMEVEVSFEFYVQCLSDITFTMAYNLSATSPAFPFSGAGVYWGANGFSDSDARSTEDGTPVTASLSGSKTITIPASTKPQKVSFFAFAESGGNIEDSTGSVSISLSFS